MCCLFPIAFSISFVCRWRQCKFLGTPMCRQMPLTRAISSDYVRGINNAHYEIRRCIEISSCGFVLRTLLAGLVEGAALEKALTARSLCTSRQIIYFYRLVLYNVVNTEQVFNFFIYIKMNILSIFLRKIIYRLSIFILFYSRLTFSNESTTGDKFLDVIMPGYSPTAVSL